MIYHSTDSDYSLLYLILRENLNTAKYKVTPQF